MAEFGDALEHAATDLIAGDQAEEAFDLAEPGGGCRSEVHMEARMFCQPRLDLGMLVGGVVVGDQMQVEERRRLTPAVTVDVRGEQCQFGAGWPYGSRAISDRCPRMPTPHPSATLRARRSTAAKVFTRSVAEAVRTSRLPLLGCNASPPPASRASNPLEAPAACVPVASQ